MDTLNAKYKGSLFKITEISKVTLEGAHKKTIRSLCWTPDGGRLLSVGFDSQMCVWVKGESTFECVATMEGHENEVKFCRRE